MRTFSGRIAIGILSFCVSQTMAATVGYSAKGSGDTCTFISFRDSESAVTLDGAKTSIFVDGETGVDFNAPPCDLRRDAARPRVLQVLNSNGYPARSPGKPFNNSSVRWIMTNQYYLG